MADTRGGFVLKARSDEPPPRRGSLVEKSTTLRKNIFQVSDGRCQRRNGVRNELQNVNSRRIVVTEQIAGRALK